MSEDEQWAKAIEIANSQIQCTDFMTVAEWLFDENPGDEVEQAVHDKLMRLRVCSDRATVLTDVVEQRVTLEVYDGDTAKLPLTATQARDMALHLVKAARQVEKLSTACACTRGCESKADHRGHWKCELREERS